MRSSMSWRYARTATRWKPSLSMAIRSLSTGKSPPLMRQQFAPSLRIWSRKLPALKTPCCKAASWIPVFALILFGTAYPNAVKAAEKLRIAWAGGSSSAPIWIVQEKGLLKKQGVDAEIIRVSASTVALQAMLAGELDVIGTSVTTLVTSRLAGVDVVMILAIVPIFPAHIVTSKSVTDLKQLKGKIGGVGRPGTTTEIGMRLALARFGVDPNVDVKLVPVGNTADALAALSKGVVQFSILVEPFVHEAEKLGYKSLVDIGSLNIPFHWNGVLTR